MSTDEKERKFAGRIGGIAQLLLSVVDESTATAWLDSSQPMLGHRIPAEMCKTEEGAQEVRAAVMGVLQQFDGRGLDLGNTRALGRKCGECTLCCRLLPVQEFSKPANQRCQHQRIGKGCAIHASADYPRSCRLWACAWLHDVSADELARPDRSHYVLDPFPDFVDAEQADGQRFRIPVLQVWVDPKFPRAHEDPALRRWLATRGERFGEAAIIRYDSAAGFVLFPPALTTDGTWHEKRGQSVPEHSVKEKMYWGRRAP